MLYSREGASSISLRGPRWNQCLVLSTGGWSPWTLKSMNKLCRLYCCTRKLPHKTGHSLTIFQAPNWEFFIDFIDPVNSPAISQTWDSNTRRHWTSRRTKSSYYFWDTSFAEQDGERLKVLRPNIKHLAHKCSFFNFKVHTQVCWMEGWIHIDAPEAFVFWLFQSL